MRLPRRAVPPQSAINIPIVLLFDWGDTLMSEDGPPDITMAAWPDVRALDAVHETLAALASHYKIALATNATISRHRDIRRALERVDLSRFVSDIFCFTDIGHKKNEPAFWQTVLAQLNVRPEKVVMIGDSFEQDVLGPRRAGIEAIWFNWKNAPLPATDAQVAVPVIRHIAELLPMFLPTSHPR